MRLYSLEICERKSKKSGEKCESGSDPDGDAAPDGVRRGQLQLQRRVLCQHGQVTCSSLKIQT